MYFYESSSVAVSRRLPEGVAGRFCNDLPFTVMAGET
jgi:hypothetical protein